ncbi:MULTISPECIES: GlxA family transcriptional regulator [unclassified Pseudomonas]|uniref:GlxA family transcriptional regulator n=1 Tax=unclassified Pseudomonas TaxID=196821 RepID=UPI002AC97BA2|nr:MULTISPECIES: GlxA family transcriptional regulator [unclassified Pseudomonas]MEB0043148.1 GlxA family transcriptional regulator [Pseudomonas sp. MH10]MEB0077703.1 GlxA family transcriptional regulator [Pseudomonas sp. MH10out]MEB0090877.1 GlxA family transcriptional regulator [Pseudomonas sp. CCI4.2]MEB0101303.1 GlxA family transcriptional regulator [Pseudomonas sp. CCI3.2]MEB0122598.1 GlxA family transcriptional regulator [Pseudomonas sp. CCI1.2]
MHSVALIIYPNFQSLSLSLGSVFECANLLRGEQAYEFHLVSETGGAVMTSAGYSVNSEPMRAEGYDTLIVSGYLEFRLPEKNLLDFVRAASAQSRRIVSLCMGVFVLAEAGLLEGKRATTHWLHAPAFKKRYPGIRLEEDRLFVVDGHVWTGAGMSAGVDLALAMVENDLGSDLARRIARKLVIYQRRGSEQSQLSALLELDPKSDRVQLALAYARENLTYDLSVEALAAVARLSPRQFSRVFREETGQTPAKAIERLRVEAARTMMETSRHPIEVVATETGFGDRERMRQAFLRAFGQPPQAMHKPLFNAAAGVTMS